MHVCMFLLLCNCSIIKSIVCKKYLWFFFFYVFYKYLIFLFLFVIFRGLWTLCVRVYLPPLLSSCILRSALIKAYKGLNGGGQRFLCYSHASPLCRVSSADSYLCYCHAGRQGVKHFHLCNDAGRVQALKRAHYIWWRSLVPMLQTLTNGLVWHTKDGGIQ